MCQRADTEKVSIQEQADQEVIITASSLFAEPHPDYMVSALVTIFVVLGRVH